MIIPSSIHDQYMHSLYSPLSHSNGPIKVRHVMTHYLSIYEADTKVSDIFDELRFNQSPWIFIQENQEIIGVVETSAIRTFHAEKYSATDLTLSTLQMF